MIVKNILLSENNPTYMEFNTDIDDEYYCNLLRYGGSEYVDIYICHKGTHNKRKICSLTINDDCPRIKYNEGKILVYNGKYNIDINDYDVLNVYKLYNIEDDMLYSVTEIEALELFDNNISKNKLKQPNRYICINKNERKDNYIKPKLKVLSKK